MAGLCSVPLLSALFSACLPEPPLATGYVEGEFVLVAPVATARIEDMSYRRGDRMEAGAMIAQLEQRDAEIAVAQARAALAEAQAQLANLTEGRRAEEIEVIEATLASAKAQSREAARETERLQSLADRGIVPQAQLDDARTRLEVAQARVVEVEANLAVARLPARVQEIAAASAAVARAQSNVEAAEWQLERRSIEAPASGIVHEVLRREGEIAGPAAPILSMLPDGAVFIRLYIPEPALSQVSIGTELRVNCDGCGDGARATVTYVAADPEFTPPVIYSIENRQKLVYLVEARPEGDAERLKPGQIVDAVLP